MLLGQPLWRSAVRIVQDAPRHHAGFTLRICALTLHRKQCSRAMSSPLDCWKRSCRCALLCAWRRRHQDSRYSQPHFNHLQSFYFRAVTCWDVCCAAFIMRDRFYSGKHVHERVNYVQATFILSITAITAHCITIPRTPYIACSKISMANYFSKKIS